MNKEQKKELSRQLRYDNNSKYIKELSKHNKFIQDKVDTYKQFHSIVQGFDGAIALLINTIKSYKAQKETFMNLGEQHNLFRAKYLQGDKP